ncbi:MAG TPA: hypothetical protein PL110_19735 [Candidatus Eremiobacteraeota bacterium]|nr:hypothetical protein [Candidatus Eremiobacteraeota bacterium]
MAFTEPRAFEPAPTATIIHAYNSDGIALVTLTDEEIWNVVKSSGANLIGKPNMHPRVLVLDRYIEERDMEISQVEQSLAIEESHASYFWEKQVTGKSSFETVCMEVNTCGDSLSPKVVGTFLDCCDYPELVSFVYYAPTPVLKGFKIGNKNSLIEHCFTEPVDCFSRYVVDCHSPINIPRGKMFIAYLYRKDIKNLLQEIRQGVCERYSSHSLKINGLNRKIKLMANSQQEEYLGCAFYNCSSDFVESLCDMKVRDEFALYHLEDCFDDSLLTTDTPFVFDHDFHPAGYTGVWLTGGTGYVALHVTPNKIGQTHNFVQFCAYIHPSMWVFERESLIHVMWPVLKLFQPEKAEIHYRISSSDITENKDLQEKFIKKRLIGLGYTHRDMTCFYDKYFGRVFYHLNIEKKKTSVD